MAPLQARMNVACKLLNDEKYTECAAEMEAMLRIYELPRYYHIKCRIILASTQDNWYDAETHRAVAEELWGHYRHTWPPGNDSVIDGQFNELRMLLDELKEAQDSDRPDDYYEFCDAELTNGESKDDTESAEAEDEGTIYFAEAEDETLHTGNVEALYKQVDSEMTGEKSEPEKNHSDMQHADDGERKGQEMVTYNHEQPKANGEGDAEPSTSQHEDTLAKDKIEEEWKEEEEQRRLRKKLPGSMPELIFVPCSRSRIRRKDLGEMANGGDEVR
ncbi:hypothetical protein BDV97DRAFT_414733 [Delphinella strobiligena]|nr:hypothetical protein BDV97DRAFT_414733 [Delphinella strobiligena]